MPGAERVRKYMIRSIFSLEQLPFLEPEGKAGYRWGRDAAFFTVIDSAAPPEIYYRDDEKG